ncbi:MAG TPA: carboxypeptidase regulatory-like domain-containing protein [Bryobacteraceae bacterium]|nr:carboxypeptidase regulatory-like domain-containing protein [Bryobacteraceae bacterium]
MLRILAFATLLAAVAWSQTTGTASIIGIITDSSGAAVPRAKITVQNQETAFLYEGESSESGEYYIPNLSSGTYQLTVEAQGFKTSVQRDIVLRINETPRINIRVEVGNVTESVNITSSTPLLETENAGVGQVLESGTVQRLPVMQKFVHRVLLYMPDTSNINGAHAVGQRQRAIGYSMDGIGGKEPAVGQVNDYERTMVASLDSIQEFKMWTNGTPAEFGHSSGGLLSVVFKSGTNSFHGSIEDRYTSGKLRHRHYLEQSRITSPFDYHEWNAIVSGPIVKDKTFFFGGFQQHYEKLAETVTTTVPSLDMLNGDFNFGGVGLPIYDPSTTRRDATGAWIRDPFPGNRIPANRVDPVARNLLALKPWLEPSRTGDVTANGPNNNLEGDFTGLYKFERYDAKIDHQFSSAHKIFGRYSLVRHRSEQRPVRGLTDPLQFGNVYVRPLDFHNIAVSDTFTFSPTAINEVRAGFNRRAFTALPETFNQDWAKQLGIPNVSPETFPDFQNGSGTRFYGLGPGGQSYTRAEDITFQENFTKVFSSHTFKTGYEMIRTRYNSRIESLPSGAYRFGGTEFPFRANTGNAFASLLLGTVVQADYTTTSANWLPRWWSHAFYVQDTWRPVRNVTLELGVRWSYESPFQTKYGQQSQFDPTARDPLTGMMGAIVHQPGSLAKKDLNNFQPRLGLAWTLSPKAVFRSSLGITHSDLFTNGLNQNFEEYQATASIQAPVGDPSHVFRLSEGPPAYSFNVAPDGSVPFVGTNYSGRNASWYDPNMRLPYVATWSAGLQYQLTNSVVVEGRYQGSAGVGLLNNWNINVIPLDVSNDPARLQQIFQSYQNFRPYPQFGTINHFSNYGHNTYHGGTWRVEKRYSAGVAFNVFYTYSKTINDADDDGTASGVTFYNRRLEKARANYDIQHRAVGVLTWDLPFGKGRRWMSGGGWKDWFLGGWDGAWTQTYQSGPPVTVTFAGSPVNYLPNGTLRPNQILPDAQAQPSEWEIGPNRFPISAQNRYFNFDAFAYPAAFTPGTLGRNTFEAPGMRWTQVSLSKEFRITERARFEIRWDVNNLTKEPQFADPNTQFNLTNRANFGTFNGTRGSFSDIGTGRMHHLLVGRFVF